MQMTPVASGSATTETWKDPPSNITMKHKLDKQNMSIDIGNKTKIKNKKT